MAKPDGEELLPEFMQAATDFLVAGLVYFGLHALTAYFLLRSYGQSFRSLPSQYHYVLSSVVREQNEFYLLHLLPALSARYFAGRRFSVRLALCTALGLDCMALTIVYPIVSLLDPGNLKNILLYISLVPFLMTFYTLRIHRLKFSGGAVIFLFAGLLSWGFFYG